MIKYMYAVCDTLSGFLLGVDVSSSDPERYVIEQNRINTLDPKPFGATTEFRLLGTIEDEKLEMTVETIKRKVGDLLPSVKKLEEYRHAREAEQRKDDGDKKEVL